MIAGRAIPLEFVVKTGSHAQDRREALSVDGNADASLVSRARQGDIEAFKILVERYQSRAHAIALGVVGSYEDAEDVVQDAFLKAYRNLGLFRGQASFYTWLYRIVFNLAIDLSRRRYRHVETSVGEQSLLEVPSGQAPQAEARLLTRPIAPDETLERRELAFELRRAIEELSAEHRTVIILREIEGLSYSEIADVVGCSKGTVMSRLHHARRRLQRTLAEFAPDASLSQGRDASGLGESAGIDESGSAPKDDNFLLTDGENKASRSSKDSEADFVEASIDEEVVNIRREVIGTK